MPEKDKDKGKDRETVETLLGRVDKTETYIGQGILVGKDFGAGVGTGTEFNSDAEVHVTAPGMAGISCMAMDGQVRVITTASGKHTKQVIATVITLTARDANKLATAIMKQCLVAEGMPESMLAEIDAEIAAALAAVDGRSAKPGDLN